MRITLGTWNGNGPNGSSHRIELCLDERRSTGFSGQGEVHRTRPFVMVDGRRATQEAQGRYRLPDGSQIDCPDATAP